MSITITIRQHHLSIPPGRAFSLPDFCVITGINGSGKSQLLGAVSTASLGRSPAAGVLIDGEGTNAVELSNPGHVMLDSTEHALANVHKEIEQLWHAHHSPPQRGSISDKQARAITEIAGRVGKALPRLTQDDFWNWAPVAIEDERANVFERNLSRIFMRYRSAKQRNDYARFLAREYPETPQEALDEADFSARYGPPPWDIVNAAIRAAGLPYRLNHPLPSANPNPTFTPHFTSETGATVYPASLSSGERTLLALSLALYNADHSSEPFPRLLLLDEPDAPLHPSMALQFLRVVNTAFIERGVRVIMTTHSPSTVALVPEESLFVMNPVTRRPEKTTKDQALAVLTSGVPTLSIVHDNRRQVWVESTYDAAAFETVYQRLRGTGAVDAAPSLTFIGVGKERDGGCARVERLTRDLRDAGNAFVVGVLDWDLDTKRKTGNGLIVLGEGRRYSIENYVFDPLLLATFLLREKDEGLANAFSGVTSVNIAAQSPAVIQSIVDHVVERVRPSVKDASNTTRCALEYCNDDAFTLHAPHWYLHTRGHDLEDAILLAYPKLNAHWRKDDPGRLTAKLLQTTADDHPRFIPRDFISLFKGCMTG